MILSSHQDRTLSNSMLLWYIIFGALHEAAHISTAIGFGLGEGLWDYDGVVPFLYRMFIGRHSIIPALEENGEFEHFVRHAGWIFSASVAVFLFFFTKEKKNMKIAACITAMEAITTDLFRWNVLTGLTNIGSSTSASTLLFCGNFGIIVLHQLWFEKQQGKAALDVLEKMVNVTMMRGAQSGGVITFKPDRKKRLHGTRSRCVNSKRTDLSKLVRAKVQRDVFSRWGGNPFPKDFVTVMSGHTRFATSSKATMDGTHPHRWTPPSWRKVYDFSVPHAGEHVFAPKITKVENYITHNGDFDYYMVNGKTYDLDLVQRWLVATTGHPMPASVDSAAIAGVIDLLRTQGCFGLSARYAICFGLPTSKITDDVQNFPTYDEFEKIGDVFEEVLAEMLKGSQFDSICTNPLARNSFAMRVVSKVESSLHHLVKPIKKFLTDQEGGASLQAFSLATINAFFDNDLFFTTKTFLKNAKGSFGLCVTSSLDAHRQVCLAARGQTMSIAFYPRKGLICYGSEQAAVKAGLSAEFPGDDVDVLGRSQGDLDNDALRLDLDDLGGEIIVLDWGRRAYKTSPVSEPNKDLMEYELMNGNIHAVLFQESKTTTQDPQLYHRMTRLSRNRLIKPLPKEPEDLVLADIQDIPKICEAIQDDWHSRKASTSLNRLTAYNLSRCLRARLDAHIAGKVHHRSIDIVLTGCEVSLWLAEQFACDLQRSFPRLRVKAVSSNKLLGLYGQEIAVPSLGFPYSGNSHDMQDSIVIIVSHSGGTFGPLSCSNLLQSTTKNIFVVTSEWDTQIGKQLRQMDALVDDKEENIFHSRIFSTEVGLRPAEPCSISVVATHQLLTNLFEYLSVVILSDEKYRQCTGAMITEQDLQILEKCNRMNIEALTEIVGVTRRGWDLNNRKPRVEMELRAAGDVWAEHILENARAYIMTAIYIFVTVVSGYPLFSAIARGTGLDSSSDWMYLVRLFDAALYFWLPQINIIILRLIQKRNLLHRMVGRTVVIGDIPWVAQAAEAFLSKIFACSYSIAGLNVLSGNPADHLVHRHTHRVVRGSLVVCGRPDGRLSALSTAEASVCLSVNQASSIQSLGGTCESITIGHNPFKLPLTAKGIFLKRKRPLFLCERMLAETDNVEEKARDISDSNGQAREEESGFWQAVRLLFKRRRNTDFLDSSSHHDTSLKIRVSKRRSAAALIGAYMNFEESDQSQKGEDDTLDEHLTVDEVVASAIKERKWSDKARKLFKALDVDGNGFISLEDFIKGASKVKPGMAEKDAVDLFYKYDDDGSAQLDYDQFLNLLRTSELTKDVKIPPSHKDERGLIQIETNDEKYFGETLRKYNAGKANRELDFALARNQHFSQELYETRIASLQRFVAMTVMFHQMGKRVQDFFVNISFGLLGYRIDRTHSIMRIATTASPISGSDVRQRMQHLQLLKRVQHSVHVISHAYLAYKVRKESKRVKYLEHQVSNMSAGESEKQA